MPALSTPRTFGTAVARAIIAGDLAVARAIAVRRLTWSTSEIRAIVGACCAAGARSRGALDHPALLCPATAAEEREIAATVARVTARVAGRALGHLRALAARGELGVVPAAEALGAILGAYLDPLDGDVEHLLTVARRHPPKEGLQLCADVAADVQAHDTATLPALRATLDTYREIVGS
jgi:hypothetical protein